MNEINEIGMNESDEIILSISKNNQKNDEKPTWKSIHHTIIGSIEWSLNQVNIGLAYIK